jgi:DnaJ family protein A protein 2
MFPPGLFGGGGTCDYKLYDRLGLEKNATESEIKKAYRRLALKYHPDRGAGDPEKFKGIAEAYEILSDADRKIKYDQFGITTENSHPNPFERTHSAPPNIFNFMFGGGVPQGPVKLPDVQHVIRCTLEEYFTGKTLKFKIQKKIKCAECAGEGGRDFENCARCGGKGGTCELRPIGPGMMQKIEKQCDSCGGMGKCASKKCRKCNGDGTVNSDSELEVVIPRGAGRDDQYRFRDAGNEAKDKITGDVVFVLQEIQHPVFVRKGDNLHCKKTINLAECLGGYSFQLTGADRNVLTLTSKKNIVTRPGDRLVLKGQGMSRRGLESRGDLTITFDVNFPETLDDCRRELVNVNLNPADDSF